jgi:hypothetical protein
MLWVQKDRKNTMIMWSPATEMFSSDAVTNRIYVSSRNRFRSVGTATSYRMESQGLISRSSELFLSTPKLRDWLWEHPVFHPVGVEIVLWE